MDLEKDLEWIDIKSFMPKQGEKIVMHAQGVYTGHYEMGKEIPPKGKWVTDKDMILNDTRWAYVNDEEFEEIKKEYW